MERSKQDPSLILIVADFAMKWLPYKYRESMQEWFGKKGIAWHGIWITWWDETRNEHTGYCVNQISTDGTEDGEAVAQYLGTAIKAHMVIHPNHTRGLLDTDGAGCYCGIGLLARLGLFKTAYNFTILDASTGEAGGGKSCLDGSFGTSKMNVKRLVVAMMGSNDAMDATSLVKLLNVAEEGNGRVVSYEITIHRGKDDNQPINTKEVTAAGLQSKSLRVCVEDSIHLHAQSGLGCAASLKDVIFVPSVWLTRRLARWLPRWLSRRLSTRLSRWLARRLLRWFC
jgi:hypothetical protein